MAKTLPHDTVSDLSEQNRIVYDYLISGRVLTNLIAMTNLGIGSLTARIAELRRKGLTVDDEWGKDHFERRYKKYAIKNENEEKTK